jgi:DNA transposition AAA+ family ATPase
MPVPPILAKCDVEFILQSKTNSAQLARELGISRQTVWRVRSGRYITTFSKAAYIKELEDQVANLQAEIDKLKAENAKLRIQETLLYRRIGRLVQDD